MSFFRVRGKFNPGMWEEPIVSDSVEEYHPPKYNDWLESLQNLGIPNPDAPPPTFTSGTCHTGHSINIYYMDFLFPFYDSEKHTNM